MPEYPKPVLQPSEDNAALQRAVLLLLVDAYPVQLSVEDVLRLLGVSTLEAIRKIGQTLSSFEIAGMLHRRDDVVWASVPVIEALRLTEAGLTETEAAPA